MNLSEKMFSPSIRTCPLRSDCSKSSSSAYFQSLFEKDWEVFVIRRDNEKHEFDWFTLCCEAADSKST